MNKKIISGIVIAGLAASYVGGKIYATNRVEQKINEQIAEASQFADIEYSALSVEPIFQTVQLRDITITPNDGISKPIYINEVILNDVDTESEVPESLDIVFNGIRIDINELGTAAGNLQQLGYQNDLMLNFSTKYQLANNKLDWSFALSADKIGQLDYNLNLANVQFDQAQPMSLLFGYPQFQLTSAEVTYTDKSLVERIFKKEAEASELTVEEFKLEGTERLQKMLDKDLSANANSISEGQQKILTNASEELIKFINNPNTFTISVHPKETVTLGDISRSQSNPTALMELLDVKFKS